jgi:SAM-dependent methyltransferase
MNKKAEKYILKLVEQGYEEIAVDFSETRKKPMKPMVYQITEDLNIGTDDKVLDLGCGNGCFFEVLSGRGNYLGLDNISRLLALAQREHKTNFKKFDIIKLEDFKEGDFNFIFSWAVFHHIPGKKLRLNFLQEVYKKLKPEGRFVFSVWKLRNRKDFYKLAFKTFFNNLFQGKIMDWADLIFPWKGSPKKSQPPRYYHAFSKKSLEKGVEKSGFKIEKFLEDDFNYYLILKK